LVVNSQSVVQIAVFTPGQNALLPISGASAGQHLTAHITGNGFTTNDYVTVTFFADQTGLSPVNSPTWYSESFDVVSPTLPAATAYSVQIDPASCNRGSLNITVSRP